MSGAMFPSPLAQLAQCERGTFPYVACMERLTLLQTMMLVTECATGVPQFWGSEQLSSAIPGGLVDCLKHQEPRAMRLVVHHGFIPLVRKCPPAAAPRWLAPALRQILPIVQTQLQHMWVERAARAEVQSQGQQGTQTEDDIVQEVCMPLPIFQSAHRIIAFPHAHWASCCVLYKPTYPEKDDH